LKARLARRYPRRAVSIPKHQPDRPDYIAKLRRCLKCRRLFESEWADHRICPQRQISGQEDVFT